LNAFFGHSSWLLKFAGARTASVVDGCPLITNDDIAIADRVFLVLVR
jgi:hypothetical protein